MSFFGLGGPGTVLEQLNAGLVTRTQLDNQFQLNLFNRILELLRELENCPAAVAALPPGTAGALSITQAELTDFINRLSTPNNMDAAAVEDIVEPIARIGRRGDRSLRRTPGAAISGPLRAVPRAPRTGSSSSSSSSSSGPSAPGSYSPPGSSSSGSSSSPGWLSGLPSLWRSPRVDGSAARSSADGLAGLELDDLPGGPSDGLPRMPAASRGIGAPGSRFASGPPFPGSPGDPNSRLGGRRTRRARKYRNRT